MLLLVCTSDNWFELNSTRIFIKCTLPIPPLSLSLCFLNRPEFYNKLSDFYFVLWVKINVFFRETICTEHLMEVVWVHFTYGSHYYSTFFCYVSTITDMKKRVILMIFKCNKAIFYLCCSLTKKSFLIVKKDNRLSLHTQSMDIFLLSKN